MEAAQAGHATRMLVSEANSKAASSTGGGQAALCACEPPSPTEPGPRLPQTLGGRLPVLVLNTHYSLLAPHRCPLSTQAAAAQDTKKSPKPPSQGRGGRLRPPHSPLYSRAHPPGLADRGQERPQNPPQASLKRHQAAGAQQSAVHTGVCTARKENAGL